MRLLKGLALSLLLLGAQQQFQSPAAAEVSCVAEIKDSPKVAPAHPGIVFHQYYLGCLSHASYLIGDEATKTAVVIDPQRDVDQYIADAQKNGMKITHVFLTHVHADFVAVTWSLSARLAPRFVWALKPMPAISSRASKKATRSISAMFASKPSKRLGTHQRLFPSLYMI